MTNYGSDKEVCPNCGDMAEADSVDVGVGVYVNYDTMHCVTCGWAPDGPDDFGFVTLEEIETLPVEAYL